MNDEYEPQCLFIGHTIKNEHGLDGEMPGTGTVGGGHNDGEVGYDKRNQGTADTEVGREVEAEERQVVVQKVAHPDADGKE